MNLEGIINIPGKSELYKVVSQAKNAVIIESLNDGRKMPLYSHNQANMLEEIGIYTYENTKPLAEIFDQIAKKENGNKAISHKASKNELIQYFREVVNDYDEEKVYLSDIKKVIRWYNSMQMIGLIEIPKDEKKQTAKKKKTKKEN